MRQRIIPEVVQRNTTEALRETQSAHDARQAMDAHNVDAVCVRDDDDHLVGILSKHDVMAHILDHEPHGKTTALREIMSRNPECLHADDDALDAMELMITRKIRYLPVVSPENRVIAMVSTRDLLRSALKMLNAEGNHAREKAFAPEDA